MERCTCHPQGPDGVTLLDFNEDDLYVALQECIGGVCHGAIPQSSTHFLDTFDRNRTVPSFSQKVPIMTEYCNASDVPVTTSNPFGFCDKHLKECLQSNRQTRNASYTGGDS